MSTGLCETVPVGSSIPCGSRLPIVVGIPNAQMFRLGIGSCDPLTVRQAVFPDYLGQACLGSLKKMIRAPFRHDSSAGF